MRFLSDPTGNRSNNGCRAVFISDVVLDNQNRTDSALLRANGHSEICIVDFTPFDSSHHSLPLFYAVSHQSESGSQTIPVAVSRSHGSPDCQIGSAVAGLNKILLTVPVSGQIL